MAAYQAGESVPDIVVCFVLQIGDAQELSEAFEFKGLNSWHLNSKA